MIKITTSKIWFSNNKKDFQTIEAIMGLNYKPIISLGYDIETLKNGVMINEYKCNFDFKPGDRVDILNNRWTICYEHENKTYIMDFPYEFQLSASESSSDGYCFAILKTKNNKTPREVNSDDKINIIP